MRPRTSLLPAGLLALTLVVSGCSAGDSARSVAAAEPAPVTTTEAALPPEESPSASPSASPSPSLSPSASPTAAPAPSYDVKAVQTKLTAMKYYGGPIDGRVGPSMKSAVMAFQKVQGIGADGIVGKGTLAALEAPRAPALAASSPSNRVEVDLSRQVLYVVKGGAIERIMPVSSGNGATYKQKNGSTAKALTPTGWYKVERRIVGERNADLGTLYDPQYFYRGWAIHGSNSVPAYPASHGCVRVTRTDAKWLLGAISNGMSVYLYGGKHVFTAGSSAPGTDNPTGDTAGAEPAPSSAAPSSSAPAPSPAPTSAQPSPSPSPSPSSPSPSPSPSDSASPSASPPLP